MGGNESGFTVYCENGKFTVAPRSRGEAKKQEFLHSKDKKILGRLN
jgi:hypothetical protein